MINQLLAAFLLASVVVITGNGGGGGGSGPGLTLLEEQDFDGTGCADSSSGDTCTEATADPDYTTTVLEGTESFYDATTSFASGGNAVATETVTLDFLIQLPTSIEGNRFMMQLQDGGAGRARIDQYESDGVRLICGATNGTKINVSTGTTYYFRLVHDDNGAGNDTCDLYISTSTFGDDNVGSDSISAASDLGDSVTWQFACRAEGPCIVDDIALCSGDAGTTEGRCDS